MLEPKKLYLDCMDFDREVCALGFTAFIRPIMTTEIPIEGDTEHAEEIRRVMAEEGSTHYLVTEIGKGLRAERGITLRQVTKAHFGDVRNN